MRTKTATTQRRELCNREQYPGLYITKSGRYEFATRDGEGQLRWIGCVDGGVTIDKVTDAWRFKQRYLGLDQSERVLPSNTTFKQLADSTFENWIGKPNTVRQYKGRLNRMKGIWRMKPAEITRQDLLVHVVRPMMEEGLSSNYIGDVLSTASKVFKAGTRTSPRLVWVNPVTEMETGTDRPSRVTKKQITTLTPEQVELLLRSLKGPARTASALMIFAGLRISEACGLQWSSVDFATSTIHVRQQLDYTATELVPLKTSKSRRAVQMSGELRKLLLAEHIRLGRQDGYVVSKDGTSPYGQSHVRMVLTRRRESLALGESFSSHTLRHTFASALVRHAKSEGDLVRIAQQTGHDIQTLLKTYAHAFGEESNAGAVIDAAFGEMAL